MKKQLCAVLAIFTAISSAEVLGAEGENIGIAIDGKTVEFTDALPFTEYARTMIPVRSVAESMGAEVEWNENTGEITMSKKQIIQYLIKLHRIKVLYRKGEIYHG